MSDFNKNAPVYLTECCSYDVPALVSLMKEAFDAIGVTEDLICGRKVLLKPNLVIAGTPESGATTHPGVLSGCIEYLQNNGFADISIIESYIALTRHGHAFPFGIYADDRGEETPVGFLLVGFDVDDDWENPPAIARGNYNLWRLMIDRRYQGKGYGREAVRLALDFIRTWPCGPSPYCWVSYEPENSVACRLYRSFGFAETGDMDCGEIVAALDLRKGNARG